jgi:iron complex transport system substrate-binding protein
MINRTLFLIALALLCGCGQPSRPAAANGRPERIISLAPNITETLYALGLGQKIVGATTFCRYPEAARELPQVGNFGSINYEAVVSLKPDLVILHTEFEADKQRLDGLGIRYLETGTYFSADILETIRRIGEACGADDEADELIGRITRRMAELQTEKPDRPRVLITFGRTENQEEQGVIHAFGPACIHTELLEMAGGRNVIKVKLPFATLSREAILRLNPDIIIELAPDLETVGDPSAPWQELKSVHAVKNNRIHVLTGDYTCIPGPRFIQTLEDFSKILRPNDEGQIDEDMTEFVSEHPFGP